MNKARKIMIIMALVALTATSLACNLATNLAQPTPIPTTTPLPPSTQAVGELVTQAAGAAATVAAGGSMVLEVTEQQLTSAALVAMQEQGETPIQNLQILLRDGQIKITGNASEGGFDLPVAIAVKVTADADGRLKTQVVSAEIGFFSLPQAMIDQITSQMDTALLSQLNTTADTIFIESITIADGKMTLVAHKR